MTRRRSRGRCKRRENLLRRVVPHTLRSSSLNSPALLRPCAASFPTRAVLRFATVSRCKSSRHACYVAYDDCIVSRVRVLLERWKARDRVGRLCAGGRRAKINRSEISLSALSLSLPSLQQQSFTQHSVMRAHVSASETFTPKLTSTYGTGQDSTKHARSAPILQRETLSFSRDTRGLGRRVHPPPNLSDLGLSLEGGGPPNLGQSGLRWRGS